MLSKVTLNKEPVVWAAGIGALISLGVGFGLHVTNEQVSLISAAVIAVAAIFSRAKVTPTTTIQDNPPDVISPADLDRD